jgi:hypothetical protein
VERGREDEEEGVAGMLEWRTMGKEANRDKSKAR